MKIPLRFQITEFDCGTVTLQNAISYLHERENIPAAIVKAISTYTLDCYDSEGNLGNGGTSKKAVEEMTNWITDYTNNNNFNIVAKHYLNNDVNLEIINNTINNKGCVVLRTYQDEEHYVLITGIDKKNVYIWDPYYIEEKYYNKDKNVKIIFNKPFDYNRQVSIKRFLSHTHNDFALGPINNRECVCFTKKENN